MNVRARLLIACLLTAGLVACGQHSGSSPQDVATSVTQAVYNNDQAGTTQHFDDALKAQVTRTQVAMISDKMHELGDFQGLTETKSDADTRQYWYDAKFSKGDMVVELKLHADGTVAAYRVIPK